MIGQLVGGNRKQIAFQRTPLVEIRQAGQKSDKRLLHQVFGHAAMFRAAFDKRQAAGPRSAR